MPANRMVRLADAPSEFHAKVLVAKLGSAGILAQVRGTSGPYPNLGRAEVWVEAMEAADAADLLDAGGGDGFPVATEDRGPFPENPFGHQHRRFRPVVVSVALLLLGSFTVGGRCSPEASRARPSPARPFGSRVP